MARFVCQNAYKKFELHSLSRIRFLIAHMTSSSLLKSVFEWVHTFVTNGAYMGMHYHEEIVGESNE